MITGLQNTQVVTRLAAGQRLERRGGRWRQGRQTLSETEVRALVRAELLVVEGDTARLTETGLNHLERLLSSDAPNRWLVERGRAGKAKLLVNINESPLGWLMRRGLITETQFIAGERLRTDFMAAGRVPSITTRWEERAGQGRGHAPAPPDPNAVQMSARRRFDAACAAAGPGLADILERVVCLGEGLEVAERAFGWPARAGKVVLGIALDRLAVHYGVTAG